MFGFVVGDSSLSVNDDGLILSILVFVNFFFFGLLYNLIFVSVIMNIFMLLDMIFCIIYNIICMYNLCIKYFLLFIVKFFE